MQINIERLHDVLEGKRRGRGDGQTLAGLVQLAQYVEFFPWGKLVHFSENITAARCNRNTFNEVLESMGLKGKVVQEYRDYTQFNNGCRVYFMSLGEGQAKTESRLRGVRLDNYVVDHFAEYLLNNELESFLKTRLM